VAAGLSDLEVFKGLFNLAKDNLTKEDVIKNLLAADNEGRTVFHVAAGLFDLELFKGIFNLAK
jgi:hypothetical protein